MAPATTVHARSTDRARELRNHVHRFLRSFGLLSCGTTPCGHPLPVSYAHALMILRGAARGADAPTLGDLAATLGIDKSNATRLSRRMQAEGHLERRTCDGDGRVRRLHLTAAGSRLAGQVDLSSRRRFENILASVPEARREALLRGLRILNDAIVTTLAKETTS